MECKQDAHICTSESCIFLGVEQVCVEGFWPLETMFRATLHGANLPSVTLLVTTD